MPLFFLVGCSHLGGKKTNIPIPSHPCFQAAAKGDLEYLQKNIEICKTTQNEAGTTPFMLAAAKGKDEVINFLLSNGVDVNEADKTFGTAINYAVVANQVNTAGLLILAGADLETKNPDGITVIMLAVQQSSFEMVRTLTTTRQAINAKAEDGWTALYFAVRREDPNVLYWLLRQGACKNVIDSYKQTPIDFAKEVGWKQGIAILEKAPACGTKNSKVEGIQN